MLPMTDASPRREVSSASLHETSLTALDLANTPFTDLELAYTKSTFTSSLRVIRDKINLRRFLSTDLICFTMARFFVICQLDTYSSFSSLYKVLYR